MSRALTFVTGNIKKLEEIKAILGTSFPHEVRSEKIDLPGLCFHLTIDQITNLFFIQNSREKLTRYAQ